MQHTKPLINENPNDRIEMLNEMFESIYGEDHKQRLLRILWVLMEDHHAEKKIIQRLKEAFEHIVVYHEDFTSFEWQYASSLNPTQAALMAVEILCLRHIIDYYAHINRLHNNLTYFILSQYWPDSAHESVRMFFEEEGGKFFYAIKSFFCNYYQAYFSLIQYSWGRKMFKKFAIGMLTASAIALSVSAATYKIGVENINYLPHYSTDKGEYSGFGREIMDAFARDAGHTFVYDPMPIKRLMKAYKSGAVDAKYPDNKYWGADDKKGLNITYSYPVVEFIDGVMVKPERSGKGVENLKTLGTVLGFTPFEYLGLIKEGKVKVTENKSFTALLKQTMIGRIDGAYINVDVAQYTLDTAMKKKGELIFDDALPHTKSHYHISSVKKPELIEEFNEWITSNKGKVAAIKAKFDLR